MKLDKAHKEFVDFLKSQNRASATILAYNKDIAQVVEFLAEKKIEEVPLVESDHLKEFLSSLEKKGYTQKSLSRKLNAIKTFFKYLKNQAVIQADPATLVAHPKIESKLPRTLSTLEYRSLRDVCRDDERIAAIVEILLQTGIRISELANLRMEDFRDSEGTNEASLFIRTQENHPTRSVPLNQPAEVALKKYLANRPPFKVQGQRKPGEENIFITKNGKPLLIRNIRTSIDRYFRKAGIKEAKVNDLRHTWLTHQLAHGASVVVISKLAGHKRLSTTEKYLNLVSPEKGSSKTKLEAL